MAFNLTFSNSLCGLLDRFIQLVDCEPQEPFFAVNAVVTDMKIAETIKVNQAKQKGVCANVRFLKIEEFIWKELVNLFLKINPHENCKSLTNDILSFLIFEFLNGNGDFINRHPSLREYLFDNSSDSINSSRVAGLASKLANLFMEYQYNRPASADLSKKGVIQSWLKGELFFTPKAKEKADICKENELWQIGVYNSIFGASGQVEKLNKKTNSKYYTVSGLYNEIFVNNAHLLPSLSNSNLSKMDKIYLFDIKGLSMFHRQALFFMSEKLLYDINVFVINPCELYWEDTDTTNKSIRAIVMGRKNSLFIDEYKDNYLLKNLGHTGKENIVLWMTATNYDYDFVNYENREKTGLLKNIQHLILENNGDAISEQTLEIDNSVTIYEFDDILSEVEHLYNSIVAVLEKDREAKLEDIGVFITDSEIYLPIIEYVFAQKLNSALGEGVKLEYSLSSLKAKESLFVSGMEAFVNLVNGDFSKKDFFAFFANPLVASSMGVDFSEIDEWKLILSELNVHRFLSATDKDSFERSEIHTFTHGIKRILLSYMTDAPYYCGSETKNSKTSEDCYIPVNMTVDKEIFNNLVYAIERIGGDVAYLRKEQLSFCQVARFFIEFADAWFIGSDDFYGETAIKRKFKSSLKQLCEVAEHIGGENNLFHRKGLLSYIGNLFKRETIFTMPNYKGAVEINDLRNGVFKNYRYIFICGLSENHYPSRGSEETVDLRNFAKQTGDVNRIRLDEYHFLEILLAASDGFYASYTGYDKKSDKKLVASSVLITLKNYMAKICGEGDLTNCVEQVQGYSCHLATSKLSEMRGVESTKIEGDEILLDVRDISLYVKNPFRYFTAKILSVYDETSQKHDFDGDEFFESVQFCKNSFFKDFYKEMIKAIFEQKCAIQKGQADFIFNELFCKYSALGFMPESIFLEIERGKFAKQIEGVAGSVNQFCENYIKNKSIQFCGALKIKKTPLFSEYFLSHNKKVFVRGEIENVVKSLDLLIIPIYSEKLLSPEEANFYSKFIELYIAISVFCVENRFFQDITTVIVVVISSEGVAEYKIDIDFLAMENYLKARLEEMVVKEHYDFTPSEIALEKIIKGKEFSAADLHREHANNYGYEKRKNLEIICDVDLTHDAQMLIKERFGNLLSLFCEGESEV